MDMETAMLLGVPLHLTNEGGIMPKIHEEIAKLGEDPTVGASPQMSKGLGPLERKRRRPLSLTTNCRPYSLH